jgi:lysozyme
LPLSNPSIKAGGLAGAVLLAATLVMSWEGDKHVAYRDINGIPTICYGNIQGVQMGDTATQTQCLDRLSLDLQRHAAAIQPCIHVRVPDPSMAAFISFSYNVGAADFCQGSVARDLNAGHLALACADLSKYVYADKHYSRGLANRRAAERAYCLRGVA